MGVPERLMGAPCERIGVHVTPMDSHELGLTVGCRGLPWALLGVNG